MFLPGDIDTWMVVFCRVTALLAVLPVFSVSSVPARVRVALGALTTLFIAPNVPPVSLASAPLIQVILVMGREVLYGVFLGFAARIFFHALDIAGTLIATQMGLMMANSFNPFQQSQSSIPGILMYHMAIFILFSLDLHHWFFAGIFKSYDVLAIGGGAFQEATVENLISATSRIFLIGVQIAGPMVAVQFLLLLLFAFLGRAVPQMNVFSESFMIRVVVGLVLLALTCQLMAEHISHHLQDVPEDMMRAAALLAIR